MSSGQSTEQLVARLVDGLEPVERIPPMRWQLLRVAAIWAATVALIAVWMGVHPVAVLERGWISAGIAVALLLVGIAGLTTALAGRIPGCEHLAIGAAAGIAVGLGIVATVAVSMPGSVADVGTFAQCMDCAGRSFLLAIPSGLIAMALALRGSDWRPALTGLALGTGATSLGALLVHMSCRSENPWHWLVAHALMPVLFGITIGFLSGWIFARIAKRSAAAERARF